jgi:hypothetical protein
VGSVGTGPLSYPSGTHLHLKLRPPPGDIERHVEALPEGVGAAKHQPANTRITAPQYNHRGHCHKHCLDRTNESSSFQSQLLLTTQYH